MSRLPVKLNTIKFISNISLVATNSRSIHILVNRKQESAQNYQSSYVPKNLRANIHTNSLLIGGIGMVVLSVGAQQLMKLYHKYQASKSNEVSKSDSPENNNQSKAKQDKNTGTSADSLNSASTVNSGGIFSGSWFARNFYDGGFEEKMTRREAALILGVRESATPERIKDAHRRILLLNHPDRGGSAYIAAKVNEAKALLMKGKS